MRTTDAHCCPVAAVAAAGVAPTAPTPAAKGVAPVAAAALVLLAAGVSCTRVPAAAAAAVAPAPAPPPVIGADTTRPPSDRCTGHATAGMLGVAADAAADAAGVRSVTTAGVRLTDATPLLPCGHARASGVVELRGAAAPAGPALVGSLVPPAAAVVAGVVNSGSIMGVEQLAAAADADAAAAAAAAACARDRLAEKGTSASSPSFNATPPAPPGWWLCWWWLCSGACLLARSSPDCCCCCCCCLAMMAAVAADIAAEPRSSSSCSRLRAREHTLMPTLPPALPAGLLPSGALPPPAAAAAAASAASPAPPGASAGS